MDIMKLSLDRKNILEFNVNIQGYAHTLASTGPKVRMILEQKDMGFCVHATKEGKMYSVVIPEMKNIMESGMCDARMEVIIDNKYFVPWESQIEFDENLKVEATAVLKHEPTPKEKKKTFDVVHKNNNEIPKSPRVSTALKTATFDKAIADMMEHNRVATDIIGNLGVNDKKRNKSNSMSRKTSSQKPVVKEETSSKSNKEDDLQLIVDMKPNGNIKKENKNVDNVVDDLKSLAKKIH